MRIATSDIMNMLIHIVGLLFIACSIRDGGVAKAIPPPTPQGSTSTTTASNINLTLSSNETTPPLSDINNTTQGINASLSTTVSPSVSNISHSPSSNSTPENATQTSISLSSSATAPTSTPISTTPTTPLVTTPSTDSTGTSSVPTTVTSSTVSSSSSSLVPSSVTTVTPSVTTVTPSVTTVTPSVTTVTPSVTTVTPSVPSPVTPSSPRNITIAETNILLVNPQQLDTVFVELSGTAGESLDGLFLIIRNASEKGDDSGIIDFLNLKGNLNVEGFFVVDQSHLDLKIATQNLDSVVVALYSDESQSKKLTKESLVDSLLYSVNSNKVDPAVSEVYLPIGNRIFVENSLLNLSQAASISFCSGNTSGFVLTTTTKNETNNCDLKEAQSYQMKLTLHLGKNKCDASDLPKHQFNNLLAKEIVSKVNEKRQCGLTMYNMNDLNGQPHCVKQDKVIAVKFIVRTVFDKQIECITVGYESLTNSKTTVTVDGKQYWVANCSQQCFSNVLPHSKDNGNNMKVTVAVVISCIGVFLVILLVVIVYMKRKRRGNLQFRMTRLDEDEDDLVGDMDDFVGNQGATFSNLRS